MKRKLTLKSLLVAGLMTVGVTTAWAEDYAMVWQNTFDNADTFQAGWVGVKSRSAASCSVSQVVRNEEEMYINFSNSSYNTVWTYTLSSISEIKDAQDYEFEMDFALTRCNTSGATGLKVTDSEGNEIVKFFAEGGDTGRGSNALVEGSIFINGSAKAETEVIKMNTFRGGAIQWYNIKISSNADGTDLTLTSCSDATETKTYRVSDAFVALGEIILDPGYGWTGVNQGYYGGGSFDNFVFSTPKVAGFVAAPTYEIIGAYNNKREFTLDCITEGVTIYYAYSELEIGKEGWAAYTGSVMTNEETVYAYAEDGDGYTSEIVSFATGTGTTLALEAATLTHSAANQYTISNSQSAVLGAPTATVHYQIDGGTEQTSDAASVDVPVASDGTLTYWLTADGYQATTPVTSDVFAFVPAATLNKIDFCTSDDNNWAIKGGEVSVSGDDTNTYYQYLDQNEAVVGDGLVAATFNNEGSTWRIQRYKGGTMPYNTTEYIALLGVKKGQIIQVECSAIPANVTNLTVFEGNSFTGNNSYTVDADGDAIISFDKGNVIKVISINQTSVSATITDAGYATYCSPYALDFSAVEGLTAYTAVVADGVVSFTSTDKVPANTGVLLKGVAGTYEIPVVANGGEATSALIGGETAPAGAFVLMNDVEGVGFYKTKGEFTLGANTAYLPALPEEARTFIALVSEATGIAEIKAVNNVENVFNLAGQRVSKAQKGLYIVNGKKVIKK